MTVAPSFVSAIYKNFRCNSFGLPLKPRAIRLATFAVRAALRVAKAPPAGAPEGKL
jgi:hypothetical protein